MTESQRSGQIGQVTQSARHPASGSMPSFDQLFADHAGFVWRTLIHFGLDEMTAEDATQDVFVVVHRRLSEYDPDRPVRSWLWGIMRRVASAHKRGQRRAERRLAVVPQPAPADAPDDAVAARRAANVVEAFLATLKPDQRQVFVLSELEGATAPEIADALGMKLNTVYSRLRAARKRFQRVVDRHHARQRGEQS